MPPGVLNLLPGFGATAGAAIAGHPDIDKVSFTGSTLVGKAIIASSTVNLKRLTLELGGKSPNIVFDDADLDAALQSAVNAFCRNSGQICSAGTRLLVHRPIYDEFLERVIGLASRAKVGCPFEPDTVMGPLISQKQMDRVLSYVEVGAAEGAVLKLGGGRVGNRGYFVEPTIFADGKSSMRIAQEEIFGPS